jgi:tRNA (cytidine/uridine-2'-O-)-methyltransferase
MELILIRPYGFSLDEKSLKRAGLDYWKHVQIKEYDSFHEFLIKQEVRPYQLIFYSTKAKKVFYDAPYSDGKYLVFGPETKGLPKELFSEYPENFYTLPIFNPLVRSLNLACAVSVACYQAVYRACSDFKPRRNP